MSDEQVSNCPECSAALPPDATACPGCGWTSVAEELAAATAPPLPAFPTWICRALRCIGVALFAAAAYACYLWFDNLATLYAIPTPFSPQTPAQVGANAFATGTVFALLVLCLLLVLGGMMAYWFAAMGDSMRRIERRMR